MVEVIAVDFSFSALDEEVEDGLNQKVPNCKCQAFSTCEWSDQAVKQISVLSKNSSEYRDLFVQFNIQICDAKQRFVWCCKNGKQANNKELEILNMAKMAPEVKDKSIERSGLYFSSHFCQKK